MLSSRRIACSAWRAAISRPVIRGCIIGVPIRVSPIRSMATTPTAPPVAGVATAKKVADATSPPAAATKGVRAATAPVNPSIPSVASVASVAPILSAEEKKKQARDDEAKLAEEKAIEEKAIEETIVSDRGGTRYGRMLSFIIILAIGGAILDPSVKKWLQSIGVPASIIAAIPSWNLRSKDSKDGKNGKPPSSSSSPPKGASASSTASLSSGNDNSLKELLADEIKLQHIVKLTKQLIAADTKRIADEKAAATGTLKGKDGKDKKEKTDSASDKSKKPKQSGDGKDTIVTPPTAAAAVVPAEVKSVIDTATSAAAHIVDATVVVAAVTDKVASTPLPTGNDITSAATAVTSEKKDDVAPVKADVTPASTTPAPLVAATTETVAPSSSSSGVPSFATIEEARAFAEDLLRQANIARADAQVVADELKRTAYHDKEAALREQDQQAAAKIDHLIEERKRDVVIAEEAQRRALDALRASVTQEEADRWQTRLTAELKRQQDELTKQNDDIVAKQRTEIVASVAQESKDRIRALKELELRLQAFERVFDWHSEYEGIAHKVQAVTLCVGQLEDGLERGHSLKRQWRQLRDATKDDIVLQSAITSVPDTIIKSGVAPLSSLTRRFDDVEKAVTTAAYIPVAAARVDKVGSTANGGASIWAHILASVAAAVTLRERALVSGNDDHARLSRAGYHLQLAAISSSHGSNVLATDGGARGMVHLADAVRELEQLTPLSREAADSWLQAARQRLLLQQTIVLVRAQLATMELSFH